MKKKILTILLSMFMMMTTFVNDVHAADSKTVSELLALAEDSFPTTLETAWTDGQNNSLFVSNNKLCVQLDGEQNPRELIGLDESISYYSSYYFIEDINDFGLYFYLENDDSGNLVQIDFNVYDPEYNEYFFNPSITVQEYLGDSLNNFPTNFNDAWTDYNGRNLYVANNALGAYDSNNTLIDSISLSSKTTTSPFCLYGENGGMFSVEFTGDGDIDYFYFEPVDSYGTFIYPRCFVMDIMPSNFPSGSVPWLNENKTKFYITYDDNPADGYFTIYDVDSDMSESTNEVFKDMDFASEANKYTCNVSGYESSQDITLTFNLNASGKTESIIVEGFTGEYGVLNGTFTPPPPVYVSDIVSQSMNQFPTSKDIGWTDGFENYAYVSNGKIVLDFCSGEVEHISLNKLTNLNYSEPGYDSYLVITDEGSTVFLDIEYDYFNVIAYETPEIEYIVMSPLSVYTILPEDFPYENDDNYWIDGTGNKLYMTNVNPRFEFSNSDGSVSFIPYCDPQNTFLTKVSENTYKAYDVVCDTGSGVYAPTDDDVEYTFITNEYGELIKIIMSVEGEYSSLSGTYQSPKTIENILALSEYVFPSTKESGWKIDGSDTSIYLTASGTLKFNDTVIVDDASTLVSIDGSNYTYTDVPGLEIAFNMDNNVLKSITISGGMGSFASATGTYLPPDPVEYNIIEGTDVVVNVSEGGNGYFRSSALYSTFYDEVLDKIIGKVYIDGKYVKPFYYEHASGSTLITIYNSYLKSLSNGTHTLKIVSSDGFAETSFKIEKNENPSPAPSPSPDPGSTPAPGYVVPKTCVN